LPGIDAGDTPEVVGVRQRQFDRRRRRHLPFVAQHVGHRGIAGEDETIRGGALGGGPVETDARRRPGTVAGGDRREWRGRATTTTGTTASKPSSLLSSTAHADPVAAVGEIGVLYVGVAVAVCRSRARTADRASWAR
jgi:hypothetical protein